MNTFTTAKNQPMELEAVRRFAPSVFADRPWDGVSARYTFIPTINVLESLMSEGWQVMRAQESRTRIEEKKGFTKHLLRLRRPGNDLAVGDVFPEIVLINSHDRGSAYQMHAGFFRLACLNGLVVADSTFARLSVRHSGRILDEVRSGADQIAHAMPKLLTDVRDMQSIELTPDERGIFARAALTLKYDDEAPIPADRMLARRRYGDERPDMWTTMNVVQENLTKGGIAYTVPAHVEEVDGRRTYVPTSRRHTRKDNSIQEDRTINTPLWMLAEEMKKLKTVH